MTTSSAPAFVRVSNPLSRRLLRIGTPMGPNVLLTVQGRTSGQPRSAAVAVLESEGRRYVMQTATPPGDRVQLAVDVRPVVWR